MSKAIVQSAHSFSSFAPVLASTPTVGNLLIAFLCVNATSLVVDTTKWTEFGRSTSTTDQSNSLVIAVYRYVQSGDTTTLPSIISSGSSFKGLTVAEISGVTGTWATDALAVIHGDQTISGSITAVPFAGLHTINSGSLVLMGFAQYNGSTDPASAISSPWTINEHAANSGSYGAIGLASQNGIAAGVDVSGTWTFPSTSGPAGYVGLLLDGGSQSQPVLRQSDLVIYGSTVPGAPPTLPMKPVAGNLVVAVLHFSDGSTAATIDTTNWTILDTVLNGSNTPAIVVYRYALSGDTASLPALCITGSSGYHAVTIFEISGMSGTIANDCPLVEGAFNSAASTLATTSQNTTAANAVAVVSGAQFNGNAAVTFDSGLVRRNTRFSNSIYGSGGLASEYVATSGSAVSTNVGFTSSHQSSYVQMIFQGSGGAPPAPSGDKNRSFPGSGSNRAFPAQATAERAFPTT